jgi:hypothetical protein
METKRMFYGLLRRTAVAAVALGLAAVSIPAAQTATTPGWSIADVLGGPFYPILQGMAASGPQDAWTAGTTTQSLVVEHWAGSQWQEITPPAAFSALSDGSVNVDAVGASSANNAWVFPDVTNNTAGSDTDYALRWNGTRWRTFRLGSTNQVITAAVINPSDVWAFGQQPSPPNTFGYGPPYAVRYNGHRWRQVSMPGVPISVSAVSAADIWALGPSAATASNTIPDEVRVAMHWNGRSWQSLTLPALAPVNGLAWIASAIMAQSATDVWVQERVSVANLGGTPGPPGVTLLHWDGTSWTVAGQDMADYFTTGMTPDGLGGLWMGATDTTFTNGYAVHYQGGQWTQETAPAEPGYITSQVSQITQVPGTTSLWAIGGLSPIGDSVGESAILQYGG